MKIAYDEFNSEVFGMQMGNIVDYLSPLSKENVRGIVKNAKDVGYRHLNVKVPTEDKITTNSFLNFGFNLVDTQLMYCLKTNRGGYKRQHIFI